MKSEFEKQFPSLHKKVNPFGATTTWVTTCLIKLESAKVQIQEHCLDKQRVMEAADKFFISVSDHGQFQDEFYEMLDELGLRK